MHFMNVFAIQTLIHQYALVNYHIITLYKYDIKVMVMCHFNLVSVIIIMNILSTFIESYLLRECGYPDAPLHHALYGF